MTKHIRNNSRYLGTKKAATLCGISVVKFRQWKISGKLNLTSVKVGTTVFYNREELEQQLETLKLCSLSSNS